MGGGSRASGRHGGPEVLLVQACQRPYSPTHQQHHGCFSTNELLLSLFLRVVGGREALLSGWSLPMNQLSGGDLSRCCGLTLGAYPTCNLSLMDVSVAFPLVGKTQGPDSKF